MYSQLRKYIFSFVILLGLILTSTCFANVLDNWQDAKAYKPKPILFLHGFARGNPNDWSPAKSSLGEYFSKYQAIGAYLEAIDFQDPNGSVDTYDSGKSNPQGNSKGWAEKVQDKVDELLAFDKYGAHTNKLNLVCHSMGGLAGRWYLANYSNNFIDKLILIGVPNLGSPLAGWANAFSKVPKLGWLTFVTINTVTAYQTRDALEDIINLLGIDINGEAVDDLDNSPEGSGFLNNLNNLPQPSNVDYFGIVGIWGGLPNWLLFGDWYGGDWIVDKDSQLGTKEVSLKDSIIISATHFGETKIAAQETDNKILKFLDSTIPELEITSPDTGKTTEASEPSVRVQGRVYKEYLPADTQLIISVTKHEDGSTVSAQSSLLKATDLWIPKNPDSPVAEFDELINFPGSGTYKVSCQIKNPAGLNSDIKDFWVWVKAAAPEQPYPPPAGYHWVWREFSSYNTINKKASYGYCEKKYSPEEWQETSDFAVAAAESARDNAVANVIEISDKDLVIRDRTESGGFWEKIATSTIINSSSREFSVEPYTPNPPYTIDMVPVYTTFSFTFYSHKLYMPSVNVTYAGAFDMAAQEYYTSPNYVKVVIGYQNNFTVTLSIGTYISIEALHYWYGWGAMTIAGPRETEITGLIYPRILGWVLTKN